MKLEAKDYIEIGMLIALKEISKKPITGGFLARPLMEKRLSNISKEKKEFIMKTLGIEINESK